ncbi:MAG: phosphatase PAP2 family protein [Burkholderiaceae bacterium]
MSSSSFSLSGLGHGSGGSPWLHLQAWLLLGSALLLMLMFNRETLDMTVSGWAFDSALGEFRWRHAALVEQGLYRGGKWLSYTLAAPVLWLVAQGLRGRSRWLGRRAAWATLAGLALIPLAVVIAKSLSVRHCPWDVLEFGGYAPMLGLFDALPQGIRPGRCFPAGHAMTGFVWLILGVTLREHQRRLANALLAFALGFGLVMGFTRILQGAHFVSHVLWSAWLAWAVAVALGASFRLRLDPRGR